MGRLSRALRALGLAVLLAAGSADLLAGVAAGQDAGQEVPATPAAGIVFDAPEARGDLGEDVVFETTFRADELPRRVDLVRDEPGDVTVGVSIAAVEEAGPGTWRARVVQTGHVAPNTTYRYHFRAVTGDGRRIVGPEGFHRVADPRFEWRTLSGDDVTVWWYEGSEEFARSALQTAEDAVARASRLLGVDEVRPVDFFIYADDRDFRQAMGPATRENVGGEAHPDIDTLFGLIGPRQVGSEWVSELIAHELAHLVFDEATQNPYGYPPRWLNEGLAVHLSRGLDDGDRAQVAAAARSGTLIPLEGLAAQFPTRPNRFGLAYAESVSAVDHLIERDGEDGILELVAALADGATLDEAFRAATGGGFAAFEDAWLASVGAERSESYGPLSAPPAAGTSGRGPAAAPLLR